MSTGDRELDLFLERQILVLPAGGAPLSELRLSQSVLMISHNTSATLFSGVRS